MTSNMEVVWSPIDMDSCHDDVQWTGNGNGYQRASQDGEREITPNTRCGIGSYKPGCLQIFANIFSFSIYYGMAGLVSTALSFYLNSQVTTLEKQFGLSSSELGLLLSMNDIGFLICVVVASHFFRYYHKPRVLAMATVIYGLCAFVSALPHFITSASAIGPWTSSNASTSNTTSGFVRSLVDHFEGESLCDHGGGHPGSGQFQLNWNDTGNTASQCTKIENESHSRSRTVALGLISFGMFFQGFAKAPRLSMVQTYIDDNVVASKTGFYIGLIGCFAVFGPAMAFAVGGAVSRIYVSLEETDFSVRDPRWVGAWWLGFLMFGFAALIVTIPLLFFPKQMAIRTKNYDKETAEVARRKEIVDGKHTYMVDRLKDLPQALIRLFTNSTYVCILCAGSLEFFSLAGRVAFSPKYLEVHYGLSTFKANMIMGLATLTAASTGMLFGGIVTTKLRLQLIGCVKLIVFIRGLSIIIGASSLLLACPQPYIAGLQQHGFEEMVTSHPLGETTRVCSSGCGCYGNAYFPVCGSDGVNYFSPCVAGCSKKMAQQYSHCACVSNMTTGNATAMSARPGLCLEECNVLVAYIIVTILTAFLATFSAIPVTVAVIRSVSERDKSIAIGVSSFVASLLGWTLGPVLYGRIIDSSCQVWHTSCVKRGACAIYDITDFRLKFHGFGSAGRLIGLLLFIACLLRLIWTSRRKELNKGVNCVPSQSDDTEQEKEVLATDTSTGARRNWPEPMRISSL